MVESYARMHCLLAPRRPRVIRSPLDLRHCPDFGAIVGSKAVLRRLIKSVADFYSSSTSQFEFST